MPLKNKRLDLFSKPTNKAMDTNTKIEILISAEPNPENIANLFQHWTHCKQQSDYDPETFIDSLINNLITKTLPY